VALASRPIIAPKVVDSTTCFLGFFREKFDSALRKFGSVMPPHPVSVLWWRLEALRGLLRVVGWSVGRLVVDEVSGW
jgi:hypothetical protein